MKWHFSCLNSIFFVVVAVSTLNLFSKWEHKFAKSSSIIRQSKWNQIKKYLAKVPLFFLLPLLILLLPRTALLDLMSSTCASVSRSVEGGNLWNKPRVAATSNSTFTGLSSRGHFGADTLPARPYAANRIHTWTWRWTRKLFVNCGVIYISDYTTLWQIQRYSTCPIPLFCRQIVLFWVFFFFLVFGIILIPRSFVFHHLTSLWETKWCLISLPLPAWLFPLISTQTACQPVARRHIQCQPL